MGLNIAQTDFSDDQFLRFRQQLERELEQLKTLLSEPGFGVGPGSFGSELELYLVDRSGRPALLNTDLLDVLEDKHYTLELNRFNLEYNADVYPCSGAPFSAMAHELDAVFRQLQGACAQLDCQHLAIGILPGLQQADFGPHAMTDLARYHALTDSLRRLRDEKPFQVDIRGPEEAVAFSAEHLTYEGACTSYQFHYRVTPGEFADCYNALQLVAPVSVALGSNSPLFLGRKLWHETRIALFKQSVDSRSESTGVFRQPARVSFGHGWLRHGAWELFAQAVRLYPAILPISEDGATMDPATSAPSLFALRLHESTVWHWNRPVYDFHDGGHLRIELRALPAGPSIPDMLANAAFTIGSAVGLQASINDVIPGLPFSLAQQNFYQGARTGLAGELVWPRAGQDRPHTFRITDIIEQLLPVAERGLGLLGLDKQDYLPLLKLIEDRARTGTNGASWQLRTLRKLEQNSNREDAVRKMLLLYMKNQASGAPVTEWSVA